MSLAMFPFLRNALFADAFVTGAASVLMIAGARLLGPLLALPETLLFWAGVALMPFVVAVWAAARRTSVSRLLVLDIVLVNVLWVIGSFAIIAAGLVTPNLFGVFFIVVQALTVAFFAGLQLAALRSGTVAA